jgi:alpha-ribazole phosphatase
MTKLILVRHGETDWNIAGRYQGQADPPLNAKGRAQAEELAAQLTGTHIDAIYSSDLQRARETAETIGRKLNLPVQIDKGLREMNQGEWEGLLVADAQARSPREWAARKSDPLNARAPGGESVAEVASRIRAAIDETARKHPAETVLIVSHGLALATFLCRARSVPLGQARKQVPENCTPEIIEWIPA